MFDGRLRGIVAIALFYAVFLFPFLVGSDFSWISTDPVTRWLAGDYLVKSSILVIIFAVPFMRHCALSSLGSVRRSGESLGMTAMRVGVAVIFCVFLSLMSEPLVGIAFFLLLGDVQGHAFPSIQSIPVYWLDMTFGLALTAVSEELAFRSVAKCVIERLTDNKALLVVLSSVMFGLIHWSHGIPSVVNSAVIGAILMVFYLRMGSIVPPIIVHYLVDIWYFA